MIKNIWKKIQSYIKKSTGVVMALGIFVVAITIFLVGNAFAALTPTKSVIITSQKTSYENNEPGSWQVEKSGKWIAKGKARVTFDVDTTLMTEDKDTDIILVLDISGSMSGDKLERVKADSTELIESLLSNKNNNAALITFDTGSTIVSDFTNDKDYLIQEINNLEDTGNTNYYQPLVNVDKILKDYVKTDDKEVIVLFLTDGYPNEDTPNQIAQYQTLKKNYPYITINGIQYEMGETILDPIKEISDNQFFADMETLNNVLFDASVAPISYDEFKIVDYIDNDYFTLDSVDDITVSQGSVKLEEENGKQKITWSIPYFKAGRDAKLTMDLNLKDEYIEQGGIYPTNESEEIISKIINIPDEDVVSNKTPVLADNYKVTYDGNSPDGSTVSNVPDEVNYSVFDTVSLTTEEPSCVGYEFKGWEIVNKNVTKVNDDHFIMPEEDVVIRAKWSKMNVSKSMDGTISTVKTLYKIMQDQSVMDNIKSEFVTNSSGIKFNSTSSNTNGKGVYERAGTENDKYPIYYYRGDIDNNHVKFAGFCWKAVRTTDTGGVKLIYDGVPDSNGVCNNTGTASQIGESVFNLENESPADTGYMYDTRYFYGSNFIGADEWYQYVEKKRDSRSLLSSRYSMSKTNYYYSSNVEYDETSGNYRLVDAEQKEWSDHYQELVGKYTCFSNSMSCERPYYIGSSISSSAYYTNVGNEMIGIGKNISYQNGVYTITDYQEIDVVDFFKDSSIYEDYYICGTGTSNTCSSINYIISAGFSGISYVSMNNGETYDSLFSEAKTVNWIYGNDVTWDGSKYTLVNTMESKPIEWSNDSERRKIAEKYHYTCLSENDTCSEVYYIHYFGSSSAVYYVVFDDGVNIESAKGKMFTNTLDSKIKSMIDVWYANNMIEYSDYLEDTVYCNDRSLYSGSFKSKDTDGGIGNVDYPFFGGYGRIYRDYKPSTTCPNLNDSFTVGVELGNGELTYPIGLLTADEVNMAGANTRFGSIDYYLCTGQDWWLLSPFSLSGGRSQWFLATAEGYLGITGGINPAYGVRPVISLSLDAIVVKGDGSSEAPYEVMLEEELYG